MKITVKYSKRTQPLDNRNFIDYFMTVDPSINIKATFRDEIFDIHLTRFVIREAVNGNKRFHDFYLGCTEFYGSDITYNELKRIFEREFFNIYVKPNKDNIMNIIDKALNRFIIEKSI